MTNWAHAASPHVLGTAIQEGYKAVRESPNEGHEDGERSKEGPYKEWLTLLALFSQARSCSWAGGIIAAAFLIKVPTGFFPPFEAGKAVPPQTGSILAACSLLKPRVVTES